MTNIKAINFEKIRNEALVGFFTDVANAAQYINIKDVQNQLKVFWESIDNFSEYTTNTSETTARKTAIQLDAKRIAAMVRFKNVVKGIRHYSDNAMVELSNTLWEHVKKPNNYKSMDHKRLTGVIENAIKDIRETVSLEKYASSYEGSEIQKVFDALCNVETEYENAMQALFAAQKTRELATNKQFRKECTNNYKILITIILNNAFVSEDVSCIDFVEKVNVIISTSVSQYKAQTTRRKKKKEEEEKAKKAEAKDAETKDPGVKATDSEVKGTEAKDSTAKEVEAKDTETMAVAS